MSEEDRVEKRELLTIHHMFIVWYFITMPTQYGVTAILLKL